MDTDGCPSPRVGHASLTLGNAFIVFGGDTKIEEADELDDNLYLLNTTSLKWTVAGPTGRRPSGRYGHTVSTIGSVLYVFGGQLDDYFFDDLICYDLTTLQSPSSQWNFIRPNSRSPPPRTNHTTITYQDKLYLFGGTDGKLWYSDTWVYDPAENTWTPLECTGFIPAPCEGHSATIVGDIMYIFGGRSAEGKDLGTLSALKIPARKWFSFQNMGPGPTPRSGHSMTAFGGHKILIMGGESPDMDTQNEDQSSSEYESTNVVYVLDTARISYPPTANQPSSEKRIEDARPTTAPASNPPGAAGGLNKDLSAITSPKMAQPAMQGPTTQIPPADVNSSPQGPGLSRNLSDASAPATKEGPTPGLEHRVSKVQANQTLPPYEKTDASPFDEKDDNSNSDYEEAHTPKSREFRDVQSDKTDTPASTIHADTSPREVIPKSYKSADLRQEGSIDTQRVIEQLKASNSWYESELASARENGFIPASHPPVDVMQLRRVSQHIMGDTEKELSERAILVEALTGLKEELNEVQETVKNQAEQASAKISEAEADRDEAFERVKLLEAQLLAAKSGSGQDGPVDLSRSMANTNGSTSDKETIESLRAQLEELRTSQRPVFSQDDPALELEKIKSDNVNLEQQLREFSDKSILAQHESSRYKAQLEQLQERHKAIEDTTDDHVKALAAASVALTASQTKASEFQNLLNNRDSERESLRAKVSELSAELESAKQELAEAHSNLNEHQTMLSRVTEQHEASSTALTSGIDRIVGLWAASKAFSPSKNASRGIDGEDDETDPQISSLKQELAGVSELYQNHQKVSSDATRELATTLQQVSFLKQELAASQKTQTELEQELEASKAELETLRGHLESSQLELNDHKQNLDSVTQEARQRSTDHEDVVGDLKRQVEEHKSRHAALEADYEGSLQYVQNADKALHKTRDELTRYKETTAKLQTEIDELRLRLKDQDDNDDNESINSSSGTRSRTDYRVGTPPTKYNSRQIDMQLRDLRAQVMILQEERDEMRAGTLEVKKKLFTCNEDLKDARGMIEHLENENASLSNKLRLVEDHSGAAAVGGAPGSGGLVTSPGDSRTSLGSASHIYMDSPVDPDHADRTLNVLSSELDQMRNQRDLKSGMFKN